MVKRKLNDECKFFDFLYKDVRILIIQYLHNRDKFALRQTCKTLFNECNSTINCLVLKFPLLDPEKISIIQMKFLENFENLIYLEINPKNNLKKLSLVNFPEENNIKILKVKNYRMKKKEFLKFQNLEKIVYTNVNSEIFWLSNLKKLKDIKLDFSNFRISTNAGEKIIKMMKNFEKLENFEIFAQDNYFSSIQPCELENEIINNVQIKNLKLKENLRISHRDDQFFENISTLELDSDNIILLSRISKMKNLKNFITYPGFILFLHDQIIIDDKNISLPLQIESFDFPIMIEQKNINHLMNLLKSLKNLKRLNFSNCISQDISNLLNYFPNLEELDCGLCQIKDQSPFKSLKKLKKICLNMEGLSPSALFRENTSFFNLESLTIFGIKENEIDLSLFQDAKNLKGLFIFDECRVVVKPNRFENFKNLKELYLGKETRFNLSDLKQMKEIGCKVEYLDLFCDPSINILDISDAFSESLKTLKIDYGYFRKDLNISFKELESFKNLTDFRYFNNHNVNLSCLKFLDLKEKEKIKNRFKK